MKYSALDLAKYILQKCIDDSRPISNLQLQKILYYVQGEFLKEDSWRSRLDENRRGQNSRNK